MHGAFEPAFLNTFQGVVDNGFGDGGGARGGHQSIRRRLDVCLSSARHKDQHPCLACLACQPARLCHALLFNLPCPTIQTIQPPVIPRRSRISLRFSFFFSSLSSFQNTSVFRCERGSPIPTGYLYHLGYLITNERTVTSLSP